MPEKKKKGRGATKKKKNVAPDESDPTRHAKKPKSLHGQGEGQNADYLNERDDPR